MDARTAKKWWKVIMKLVNDFNENKIAYSFDASTSLFVHGIDDFDMGDLDIMIQWDQYERVYQILEKYNPTPISQKGIFWHFRFCLNDMEIHVMSSEQINSLEDHPERVSVEKYGEKIWAKSIHFYRRHTNNFHFQKLIDDYLRK